MAFTSRKFQAPKGMRDFYPQEMAVRRYLEGIWRKVSINHGFEEIDGPTFEDIELYTHKSGPGIVSEIFGVFSGKDEAEIAALKSSGRAPFALRPEFTPTLARMVAAKAAELPRPIKWFAIPTMFRAERPQRGRLREHVQWNVDFVGEQSAQADAEVIGCCVDAFRVLGLDDSTVRVLLNDRGLVEDWFRLDPHSCSLDDAFGLLDKRNKAPMREWEAEANRLGFDYKSFDIRWHRLANRALTGDRRDFGDRTSSMIRYFELLDALDAMGITDWCIAAPQIVRGLAYYTGLVFEVHETTGAERAIAGGGRYDNLIESFGGPSLPACGFGMGDVVLSLVLHDKGLLPEEVYMQPLRPHAFVIAADDDAAAKLPGLVAQLRREGFHVRHSYKTTRNVGKLLSEAGKCRALSAIILGKDLHENKIDFKDLTSGEQKPMLTNEIVAELRRVIEGNAQG